MNLQTNMLIITSTKIRTKTMIFTCMSNNVLKKIQL